MIENNEITILPKPYNDECTPYNVYNFDYETKKKVRECSDRNVNKVFKVIVVGDVSVGKTCIVNRFCHRLFDGNYKATIGVDFEVESFNILGLPVTLHIWDTAGQEKFKCIAQSYYRGAHAIIVAFDFSSLVTLSNCELWLKEALDSNLDQKTLVFLVGNKLDLLSPAAFKNMEEIAMSTAKNLSMEYWPVCAKTGFNVHLLFTRMAGLLFDAHFAKEDKLLDETLRIGNNLQSNRKKSTKKKKHACVCNH
ncbi:hypothetical protein RN001_011621 [Aquatica leii]|uniref:Ras-related protein Rab-36 n=1 Tax=Aquatica leii TaxID=1421715 RepID=A0AAN7P1S7_9COLE|nr:hypothetical protein RN001_011621 [Aquatica leii]